MFLYFEILSFFKDMATIMELQYNLIRNQYQIVSVSDETNWNIHETLETTRKTQL